MKSLLVLLSGTSAVTAAVNTIFATITDPGCEPCVADVVAEGPSNGDMNSDAFAEYLCIGRGAQATTLCIPECGSTTSNSDDPMDTVVASNQSHMITLSWFSYCVNYYPQAVCGTFGDEDYAAEACSKVGQATPSTGSGSGSGSCSGSGSSPTKASGTAAATAAGGGSAATAKTQPQLTSTATAAGGAQQPQKAPGSGAAAAASAMVGGTLLIRLVALAINV